MSLAGIKRSGRLKSRTLEEFRRLKTNIELSGSGKRIKVIMLTSSSSGEGRTSIAANLAMQMAQGGKKTVLIDCDLRNPQIHKMFNTTNTQGLLSFLEEEEDIINIIKPTKDENLFIITAGRVQFNSPKLINSPKLKDLFNLMTKSFEYVFIDTPPVEKVADAQILSQYSDGCIFVVGAGEVKKESIILAKEMLEKVNANILGVVLNKTE